MDLLTQKSFTVRMYAFSFLLFYSFVSVAQDDEFDVTISEDKTDFNWKTPAGKYLDPSSFFSLHGYVNGVYAGKSADWTAADPTKLSAPGQLLVPNTSYSSFQYDFAIIIGSEMNERTRLALEAHYVSDPSGQGAAGPGGITIAITEATGSFDVIPKYLTVSGGIFWAPFGIVNQDWLGAQNNFSLLPRASGAFPVHYNERGVRINGVFELGDDAAINYVGSIGNGLSNYNISGQRSYDTNENKTINGRIGIYPGLADKLNIGISYMTGELRNTLDAALGVDDPLRYAAETNAFGLDATFEVSNLKLRTYMIQSKEKLAADGVGNSPGDISRLGIMGEVMYLISLDDQYFKGFQPRLRYDMIELDQLINSGTLVKQSVKSTTISVGLDLVVTDNFRFAFDYNTISESGQTELDNNRFVGKIVAQF